MLKQFLLACLVGLVGLIAVGDLGAVTVRALLLDEVIDGAAVAFHGTCIANRVEHDAATRFIVTYTTFEVRDAIKGLPGTTHVIKQIGGLLPDGVSGMLVQGVPTYKVGEDYVVFLAGVSSLGFSSPVGLSQGSFAVQEGKAGKTIATSRPLRELIANMPAVATSDRHEPDETGREIGIDDFKRMARTHAKRLP